MKREKLLKVQRQNNMKTCINIIILCTEYGCSPCRICSVVMISIFLCHDEYDERGPSSEGVCSLETKQKSHDTVVIAQH